MRRYIQNLSPEDRRTWRQWQAGWICFYLLMATTLFGIGSYLPSRNAELAQSLPTDMK